MNSEKILLQRHWEISQVLWEWMEVEININIFYWICLKFCCLWKILWEVKLHELQNYRKLAWWRQLFSYCHLSKKVDSQSIPKASGEWLQTGSVLELESASYSITGKYTCYTEHIISKMIWEFITHTKNYPSQTVSQIKQIIPLIQNFQRVTLWLTHHEWIQNRKKLEVWAIVSVTFYR